MPCTMGCIMLSGMGGLDLGALRHGLYMNFQGLCTSDGDKWSGGSSLPASSMNILTVQNLLKFFHAKTYFNLEQK